MKNKIVKISFVLLSCALLFSTSIHAQKVKYVTATTLNIREEPNAKAEIVGKVQKREAVNVLSVKGGWANIKTSDNIVGYVAIKYLATNKPANNSNRKTQDEMHPVLELLIMFSPIFFILFILFILLPLLAILKRWITGHYQPQKGEWIHAKSSLLSIFMRSLWWWVTILFKLFLSSKKYKHVKRENRHKRQVHFWDMICPWHIIVNKNQQKIVVKKRNWFLIGFDEHSYQFNTVRNVKVDTHLFGADIFIRVYAGHVAAYSIHKDRAKLIRDILLNREATGSTVIDDISEPVDDTNF